MSKNKQEKSRVELGGIFGFDNRSHPSPTLLHPGMVCKEPLSIVSGAEYTSPGINGKGLEGSVPTLYAENLVGETIEEEVGFFTKLVGEFSFIKETQIQSPTDEDVVYHMFHDTRIPDVPQAIVKTVYEIGKDGKRVPKEAEILNQDSLVLKEKTIGAEDILGTLEMLQHAIVKEGVTLLPGWEEALRKEGIERIESYVDAIRYIGILDRYIARTEENMEKIGRARNSVIKEAKSEGRKIRLPEVVEFETIGEVSEKISYVNFQGLELKSIQDARAFVEMLHSKIPEEGSDPIYLLQHDIVQSLAREAKNDYEVDLSANIYNVGTKRSGYDQNGNIIFIESSDVPLVNNKLFYKELKENERLSLITGAKQIISRWRWSVPGSDDYPSDGAVQGAINTLILEGKKYVEKMFASDSPEWKSLMGQIGMIKAENMIGVDPSSDGKAQMYYSILRNVGDFCQKAIILEKLREGGTIELDGLLRKDKSQIRHYHFASRQIENYPELKGFKDKEYDSYIFNVSIPMLSFAVDGSNVRAVAKSASIAKIYRDKNSGEVLAVSPLTNSVGSVSRTQMRFGRILSEISELKDIEDLEERRKKGQDLINYGFGGKGYGLLAEKERESRIGEFYQDLIDKIYDAVKAENYEKAAEIIGKLGSSDSKEDRELSRYIKMVNAANEKLLAISPLEYSIRGKEASSLLVNLVNFSMGKTEEGKWKSRDDIIEQFKNAPKIKAVYSSGDVAAIRKMERRIGNIEKASFLIVKSIDRMDQMEMEADEKLPKVTFRTRDGRTVSKNALLDAAQSLWYGAYSTSALLLTKKSHGEIGFNGSMSYGPGNVDFNVFVNFDEELGGYRINKEEFLDKIKLVGSSGRISDEVLPVYQQISAEVAERLPEFRDRKPLIGGNQGNDAIHKEDIGIDGGLSYLIQNARSATGVIQEVETASPEKISPMALPFGGTSEDSSPRLFSGETNVREMEDKEALSPDMPEAGHVDEEVARGSVEVEDMKEASAKTEDRAPATEYKDQDVAVSVGVDEHREASLLDYGQPTPKAGEEYTKDTEEFEEVPAEPYASDALYDQVGDEEDLSLMGIDPKVDDGFFVLDDDELPMSATSEMAIAKAGLLKEKQISGDPDPYDSGFPEI